MRIELDEKHVLCSDKWCCWVMEKRVAEETGNPYEVPATGYFHTFEQLIESELNQRVLESQATTLKGLAKDIKAAKKELKKWIENKSNAEG